jgi:hypothetical protein
MSDLVQRARSAQRKTEYRRRAVLQSTKPAQDPRRRIVPTTPLGKAMVAVRSAIAQAMPDAPLTITERDVEISIV